MAREYPFQVVPKPGVLPDAVNVSAQTVGRALQSVLTEGLQTATMGLRATQEEKDRQNTIAQAAAKLAIANDQIRERIGLARVEQDTNQQQNEIQAANTLLAESEDKRRDLERKVELGLAATIASKPLQEVEALMSRGNQWILDPDALSFAEELYGKRLAQEDLGKALDAISVAVQKDPNVSFSKLIDDVAASRQFSSGQVAASYLSTLRGNADRYFTSKQLETIEQRLREGIDTLKLDVVHGFAFDAKENLLTGNKVLSRLVQFEQDYRRLRPAASQLEVLAQTAEVLDKSFDGNTMAMNLPQMTAAYQSVKALADANPGVYGPVLSGLGERIAKARNDQMQATYDAIKTRIDAATDNGSLSALQAALQSTAQEGGLTSDGYVRLTDQLLGAMERNRRKQTVSEVLSGANGQSALTAADDKHIDERMQASAAENGWSFAQMVGETARRANRLTSSQLDTLRGLAAMPIDPANPQTIEAVNNAVAGFEAIRAANPRLARELSQQDSAGRRLSVLADARHYFGLNPVNLASELAKATEQDFIQADRILGGEVSSEQATKAADFSAIVQDVYGGWFSWDVDRPFNEAATAYKAAFRYAYGVMKSEGKGDEETVIKNARAEATRLIQSGFYKVSLGSDDILGDTHLVHKSRFPYDPQSKMGEQFMRVARRELRLQQSKLFLANRNVIDDMDDITVDLDAASVEGGNLVVPFLNRQSGMTIRDRNGVPMSISVPVAEEELKKRLKDMDTQQNKLYSEGFARNAALGGAFR